MCLPNVTQRFLVVISFLICQASRTVSEGWVGVHGYGAGGTECGCWIQWSMTHPVEEVYRIKEKAPFQQQTAGQFQ